MPVKGVFKLLCRLEDRTLGSIMRCQDQWCVQYKPDKITIPSVPDSLLFCYLKPWYAYEGWDRRTTPQWELWRGQATDVQNLPMRAYVNDLPYDEFWREFNEHGYKQRRKVPGLDRKVRCVYGCTSFIPRRRIDTLRRWTGCIKGNSIIGKIGAKTEAEARKEVARQLQKPGRRPIYLDWLAAGMEVMEV